MGFAEKLIKIPELVKIEYALFVLPFTYIGMLLAGIPTLAQFLLITTALISARGAAFSINRLLGQKADSSNPKKSGWSSVRLYTRKEMSAIAGIFVLIFLSSALALNPLAFILAPFIVLFILLEPYAKKYTVHRHFTMGLVIGLGIFGGYIGVAGHFPTTLPIYVLLAGYAIFSGSNDIIYTMGHIEHDIANRLYTYPSRYGIRAASIISELGHYSSALLFVLFGYLVGSALMVAIAFAVFVLFLMEHRALSKAAGASRVHIFEYNIAVSLLMLAAAAVFMLL